MATVVVEKETVAGQDDVDSIDIGNLRVVAGVCCGIVSLYTAWPNCCGGVYDGEILCLQGKSTCCKPSSKEGIWCIFMDSECVCRKPTTCLGCNEQFFCLDYRCALPCNDKVPCLVGTCGAVCCYKYACKPSCCKTLAQIDPESYSHEEELDAIPQANVGYGAPIEIVTER
jgi:hypothetical protein